MSRWTSLRCWPYRAERLECSEWPRPTVHGDYHIKVDRHCCSVPYQLVHEVVDVRPTAAALEVFYRGARVTAHARSYVLHGSTTKHAHRSPNHQAWAQADSTKVMAWSHTIGPVTAAYVQKLVDLRPRVHNFDAAEAVGFENCVLVLIRRRLVSRAAPKAFQHIHHVGPISVTV